MKSAARVVVVVLLFGSFTRGPSRAQPEAPQENAPQNPATPLDELSGILHTGDKTIMPYLLLDSSNERCYLQGSPLAEVNSGARIYVKGQLRSRLFECTRQDFSAPNAPAPPPFRKGWVIYMDVKAVETIEEPFGGVSEDKRLKPTEH